MTDYAPDYELDDDQIEPWSPDFRTELAKQLAEIAPEAVADGKIDVETLKKLLGEDTSKVKERFGLFWPGKRRAMRAAQAPTSATLVPDFENSKDWDTTKNVFIEGDNLEVLKILQKHYHGKIKMIYIDPPYNTGKDFVYPDNYREGLDNYLEWSKQVNEEGQKLSTNTETDGRFHSNWLTMMYPRLKLAKNLLTNDGLIFVSISYEEVAGLRLVMNEIFGEQNFIGHIIWNSTKSVTNTALISVSHTHNLLYARDANVIRKDRYSFRLPDSEDGFSNPDNDPRGAWKADPFQVGGWRPNQQYEIINPKTGVSFRPNKGSSWKNDFDTFQKLLKDNRIVFGTSGEAGPQRKRFLSEALERGRVAKTLWDDLGTTSRGTQTLKSLMGTSNIFDNPKPVDLIVRMLQLGTGPSDIVLDFFAGSGTTAHAVMLLNAEDGGRRRHIQVQLPEPTQEKSAAREAGYRTIAEISRERIRRAGEQIEQSNSELIAERTAPLDTGFRAYKLSDTNFTKWHLTADAPANEVEQHILDIQDSAKDSATQDALLTELLLKQGMSLTERVTQFEVAGLNCHAVLNANSEAEAEEQYVLIAYVDEHTKPSLEQLRAIVELQPARLVILEDAFQGDDQLKTNLKQMCVTNDIELKTA